MRDAQGGAILPASFHAEKLRQASKRLDEAATPQGDRVRFLTTTGAQLASFGYTDEGISYLEQALALDPENAELPGWARRGGVRERS